jgi:S-DNA-T family DNA segregation ATPase FtsK/SpoIIIE
MSVVIFKRPPRLYPKAVPTAEVRLEPPPELPRRGDNNWLMQLLPALGGLGMVGFMFMPGANAAMYAMGGVTVLSMAGYAVMLFSRRRGGNGVSTADARRDYLRYLSGVRREITVTANAQRDAQRFTHPDPDHLWTIAAASERLWERRPSDGDFTQVRVGAGAQRLATPIVAPETAPLEELEPLCAQALARFVRIHGTIGELPMAVSLRAFGQLSIVGDEEAARGLARGLLAQLTAFHAPDDLVVAVCASDDVSASWDWVKWLPHVQHRSKVDGAGPVRMVSPDLAVVEDWLGTELTGRPRFNRESPPILDAPHLVVILDGGRRPRDSTLLTPEGLQGVTVIEVNPSVPVEPGRGTLRIVARADQLSLETGSGASYQGSPDYLGVAAAEAFARQLAPLRLSTLAEDEPLLANLAFTDLMGVGDAASVDVTRTWRPRLPQDRLRVPVGLDESGDPVALDIKEAALDGMGPHGLVVGATGSGKSEFLRTLVLALAMTHSSETLNFVLTDFKGGATFAGMAELPHVAAVITNLADDLTQVDRMRDAITGELQRRQELLRSAGNYANIHDYERARGAGAPLKPLPSLMMVVDEFSELLTAKPDFIDMFIQIGRVGRSLGVHLLLASQRLEEGRLRGLDTYLSYRIGLRTFSASESRTVLGVPDAYHLPSIPGSGYLKFDTESMVRFKAAYVSGPYRPLSQHEVDTVEARRAAVFSAGWVAPAAQPALAAAGAGRHALASAEEPAVAASPQPDVQSGVLADTVLDVIVARLQGQGPPAHQVWLPPLSEPPTLDELLPPLAPTPERGLSPAGWTALGRLTVPLGVVDKPFDQRRDVLYADLSGAAGHAIVVGGPRSGKSTLLRTLISSFALTHTPREAQFCCLDFGGGGLSTVAGLPHVSAVAGRLDAELVRRVVSEVSTLLDRREEFFRAHGIDSISTFRHRRAQGEFPEEAFGDVFLVIDGWLTLRQDFEQLEPLAADIAQRGLGYGVHLVLSAGRWAEVRPAVKDAAGTRLELRLGDPMESEMDRRVAGNVPVGAPGRGMTAERLHFMAALPRIDGTPRAEDLADGSAALESAVAGAWRGPATPKVRMLPTMVPYTDLPGPADQREPGVPIGVDEARLAPVYLDFASEPHFLAFGDSETGKTGLLRAIARGIAERHDPAQARFIVVDYRHTLLDAVSQAHQIFYAASGSAVSTMVTEVRASLDKRLPGADVTPEQLRNRSWWQGPDLYLLVDDYDLVATGSNPLLPLLDLLPLAKDIGLHLIVARRAGGAGRAMFEPLMQRLKELSSPGILLSGDREEGPLIGNVRPGPQPPGRGQLVTRRHGTRLVQLAWTPDV